MHRISLFVPGLLLTLGARAVVAQQAVVTLDPSVATGPTSATESDGAASQSG